MPDVTVITMTARPAGVTLVKNALARQQFDNFEWIIGTPYPDDVKKIVGDDAKIIPDPPKYDGDYWVLNRAYNIAIRESKGTLVVSWQDYTYATPQALQKFWHAYEHDNKAIVSGVGNKYEDDQWIVQTWQDPRKNDNHGTFYECYFPDIEFNFAAIPKQALYDVGGFDEYLDKYAGMDGYSVVERLELLGGYRFFLDQSNETFSLEHGRPDGWEENNALHGPYRERRDSAYIANPVLPYLC